MDYSPLGSSIHRVFQARILEQVAISSSGESSWLRDQTCVSCIGRWIHYTTATWEGGIFITSPFWSFSSIRLWTYCFYNESKRCKKLSFRKIKGTKCSHDIGEWFMIHLSQQNRMAICPDTPAQGSILKNERPPWHNGPYWKNQTRAHTHI